MTSPVRCLISAGPTREFLDPVRFLSNPSSGKMGYALATAAHAKGWEVDLVSGPVSLSAPAGVRLHRVITGQEMYEACANLFPTCDILIMCAAVMDMRPKKKFLQKQKKETIEWNVEFEPVVDILKTLSKQKTHQTLVGFAAETNDLETYARKKLKEKNLDWIVANDVSRSDAGFGTDQNSVTIFSKHGDQLAVCSKPKLEIASDILEIIVPGKSHS